jgi:hypothetical protein
MCRGLCRSQGGAPQARRQKTSTGPVAEPKPPAPLGARDYLQSCVVGPRSLLAAPRWPMLKDVARIAGHYHPSQGWQRPRILKPSAQTPNSKAREFSLRKWIARSSGHALRKRSHSSSMSSWVACTPSGSCNGNGTKKAMSANASMSPSLISL